MSKILLINFIFGALALTLCNAIQIRSADFRKIGQDIGTEYVPPGPKVINYAEPNCDELRAMWRFSRRQSRAAEITNEIPTYRDPFAYNIWEKYPKARSVVSAPRPTGRVWSRPIYGRVVQNAPSHHPRVMQAENPRVYEGVLRYLETDNPEDSHRRNFGLAGTFGQPNRMSQAGSFQRLKELVWAERMKELHQQRLMEEGNSHSSGVKEVKIAVPYTKPYQGQQKTNYVEPYNQEKGTRLKMITDHFNNNNNNNNNNSNNNNNNDGDMSLNEEPSYRRPYRQRSVGILPSYIN